MALIANIPNSEAKIFLVTFLVLRRASLLVLFKPEHYKIAMWAFYNDIDLAFKTHICQKLYFYNVK